MKHKLALNCQKLEKNQRLVYTVIGKIRSMYFHRGEKEHDKLGLKHTELQMIS